MKTKILAGALSLLISLSAFALDLAEAKSLGLIGEQTDGYVGLVKASPEAESLVVEINSKRKEAYIKIAAKNNLSVQDVATLAGKKLINKAEPGEFVQSETGKWIKK